MKKVILTTAITAALLPLTVQASDEVDFYGKLTVSLQNQSLDGANGTPDQVATDLVNHASRLGVKGEQKMPEGFSVIYQAEYQIYPVNEDKASAPFKQRNIFVGVKGTMGTLKAGFIDTPLKKAQAKVDLFSDILDMKSQVQGENRVEQLNYTSPKFNGLTFALASVVDDGRDNDANLHDSYSTSVSYKTTMNKSTVYAAVAYDSDVDERDTLRVVAQYNIDALALGALWQQSELSDGTDDSVDAYLVSAAYKMGKNTIKAQYVSSDKLSTSTLFKDAAGDTVKAAGDDASTITLGVDHKLGKSTTLFAYGSYTEVKTDDTLMTTGVGMTHKF